MKKVLLKTLLYVFILIFIYFLIISFAIYPCITQGMSMYPTIGPNEIILTNRWKAITNKESIKRGDIVTIEEPSLFYVSSEEYDENNVVAHYSNKINFNPFRTRWLKRVIGIAGDHIQITKDEELYINGIKQDEDYVDGNYTNITEYGMEYMYIDLIVPENTVYVMGDNRIESADSRSFGCVPLNKVYSVLF